MPLPYSTAKKLRIQFQKSIRRGFVKNAEIDPQLSAGIAHLTEPGESFIVRVERTKGGRYWFSDRRVVFEDVATAQEVFRYQAVRRTYWMFKNLKGRLIADPPNITNLKTTHFDRLEIDIGMGECVLDGLGQAYVPTLGFLQWMLKPRSR